MMVARGKRQGIEWAVTGDVHQEDFERFRDAFHHTMSDAIEAERGRGYLERLSKEIDARVEANHVKSASGHAQ